jgi:hypothetical protein
MGGNKKGQVLAVLDDQCKLLALRAGLEVDGPKGLINAIKAECGSHSLTIGIDAPRRPVGRKREKGGRQCERALHGNGVRLFWTPKEDQKAPEWIANRFQVFQLLSLSGGFGLHLGDVSEVFPSASYSRFPSQMPALTVPPTD